MNRLLTRGPMGVLVCILSFLSSGVRAQLVPPANGVVGQVGANAAQADRVAGQVLIGYDSNFYERSSYQHEQTMYSEFTLIKPLPNQLNLVGVLSANKDLYNEYENKLDNGLIALTGMNTRLGPFLALNSFSAVIPLSETSRKLNPLKTSLRVNPTLIYTPKFFSGLNLVTRVTFGKNFHDFTTRANGEANSSYFVRPDFIVAQAINDKWTIAYRYRISQGYSYEGERLATRYGSYFNAEYNYSQSIVFSAGLSTSGNIYREDGATANVEVFDNTESYYNFDMAYRF